jgi:hypothetical protein
VYDEGVFKMRALRWGWEETTNGHERFSMTGEVLGVVDRNNPEDPASPYEAGVRSWSITVTNDRTADWLSNVVLGLGYDGKGLSGLDPDEDDAFDFTGVEFLAECKHSEYQGQIRENWSVFQPRRKSLAKERVHDLDERLGHVFREAKARKAAKATPKADVPEGDIPF